MGGVVNWRHGHGDIVASSAEVFIGRMTGESACRREASRTVDAARRAGRETRHGADAEALTRPAE
jgi:hypothetical protein